jgi:shikimate kinase
MNNKTVILIGFSTAGKSHYLKTISELNPFPINHLDSDKFVATEYDEHIFNIFMKLGRDKAIQHIETKERDFIKLLPLQTKPTLVAAGPWLVIRDGWESYYNTCKPHVIYLSKSAITTFADLCKRKDKQRDILDKNNPHFGSWDHDVTTQKIDGRYQDLPEAEALQKIKKLIYDTDKIYKKFAHEKYDSDILRADPTKSSGLVQSILDKLK